METETSVSVQWPRPCDVMVRKYYDINNLIDDIRVMFSTYLVTVTEQRLRMLNVSEHLLAYRGFGMAWSKVIKEIICKLEEHAENITTFDANEYIEKLKALL